MKINGRARWRSKIRTLDQSRTAHFGPGTPSAPGFLGFPQQLRGHRSLVQWHAPCGGLSVLRFLNRRAASALVSPPLWSSNALALDPRKAITQYHFHDVWQTQQGLPQNSVLAVVQGHDGFIWFGDAGRAGPVRRSPIRRLQSREHQRSRTPVRYGTPRRPRGRAVDRHARRRADPDEGRRIHWFTADTGLKAELIGAIAEDRRGVISIGSRDRGLIAYDGGRFREVAAAGLASLDVRALYPDQNGSLWVGTAAGLARFRNGSFVADASSDGIPAVPISSIVGDGAGGLWVGSRQRTDPMPYGAVRVRARAAARDLDHDAPSRS